MLYRNPRQFEVFTKYKNSIHTNIKFVSEIENNRVINFLHLTIKDSNNKHQFFIYRNSTYTYMTTHAKLAHPLQEKLAALHSMVYRLVN